MTGMPPILREPTRIGTLRTLFLAPECPPRSRVRSPIMAGDRELGRPVDVVVYLPAARVRLSTAPPPESRDAVAVYDEK